MLRKQNLSISFAQGVDTKTDPWQIEIGKFQSLNNTIFTKAGLLQKRNGYPELPSLIEAANYVTTFNGDLTAIGTRLQALASGYNTWVDRGAIEPVGLSTLPLIRNNLNQTQVDSAIAANGLICTVYSELNNTTTTYKYAIADSVTGQNVIAPTVIPSANTTHGWPRVFYLGIYFIIVYGSSTANHISYFAISSAVPNNTIGPTDVTTSFTNAGTLNFDGVVFNGTLYLAWNGAASSGVKMATLTSQLVLSSSVTRDGSHLATLMTVTTDAVNSIIWVGYYDSATMNAYGLAVDPQLNSVLAATLLFTGNAIVNLASAAQSGTFTLFSERTIAYSYDSGIPTNLIAKNMVTQAGSVGGASGVVRSAGLASKGFLVNGVIYFLSVYQSPYQSTYFLINGSTSIQAAPMVIAKLAHQNAGGYITVGALPSVTVTGETAHVGYLIKDLIEAANKNTNVPAGTQINGIYTQSGLNLANFTFGAGVISAEIGSNLNLTGGFLWAYDGYTPVEQNFYLYPDSVEATGTATTGGFLAAQIYFYQVTYEWSDNQGNVFRSAPSIPVTKDLTGAGTATSTVTLQGPNLRLTYKTANPVKIVIYRWSTAQPVYYQVTSLTAPILNSTTADSWTFTDTLSDATILGNNLLYTTGGVLEDIGPPSFSSVFLFDDRLWGITSEDPNLLWFSKQVIEATPVEMSDLLTMYIAPSLGAQGPSGDLTCGFPMDDKAVLFKKASIAYFNGTGPDNTGANSQYSPPILVTSTLGCSNQKSIVFMPNGLMFEFQSEAGNQIWLLGRDLSTNYIGAPVESYTENATVESAVNIPGTNQVRFTMSTGITLMYDYYYGRWGTFTGIPAVSSTLYQGLHTFINQAGQVFQESPGTYLDGSNPVLISFTTGWLNLAGLQGYLRAYYFFLLGKYLTPHKLMCQIAYDYNPAPSQGTLISPTNFSPAYGSPESNGQETVYGQGTPYGGQGNVENWRVFLDRQRCSAFQITIQEVYDPALGVPAGEGLTLSGINLVYAGKSGWRPISAAHDAGGQPV